MNIFELRDVTKSYETPRGIRTVLRGVTLSIPAQSLISFFGANGVGKTTLMSLIAGILRPDSGTIVRAPSLLPRDVAVVPQDYRASLPPWQTVRSAVEFPLRLRGVARGEAHRRFDRLASCFDFGVDPHARVDDLSGGEAQLTSLMRALIIEPRVLILDEFLAAMDYRNRTHLRQFVVELTRKLNLTLLAVTHSLDEALLLGTRVMFLEGRPARIVKSLDVDLEFPRTTTTETSSDFVAVKQRALNILAQIADQPIFDTGSEAFSIRKGAYR